MTKKRAKEPKNSLFEIPFPEEKLRAISRFSKQKNIDLQSEANRFLERMYKKIVPKDVREFLEIDCEEEEKAPINNTEKNDLMVLEPTLAQGVRIEK